MYSKTLYSLFLALFCTYAFAQPNIQLTSYVSGYSSPVDIANAGDGRLFIVEQGGTIRIVDSLGNKLPTPFLSKSVTTSSERGLLGLAFDPAFTTNGYFYIYYSQGSNSIISRMSVSVGNPNVADPASETIILTVAQPFSNHNGGDIEFGPDGYLYIGLGDGGSGGDPGNRSQNPLLLLGKMLRIDVSTLPYTIPADNPFVGDPSTLDEIWAIGLRNPWRWSFDRLTGDMWIGDVGQGAREEISYAPAGAAGVNYGWRCYEGNVSYNLSGCGPISNYEFPVYDFPRSLGTSVTGGYVYRGQDSPTLDGIYFFGDYGSGRFWGIWPDIANPGSWTTHEFFNTTHKWSTFGEDSRGELYAASYSTGTIYRVESVCVSLSANLAATDASCANAANGTITLNLNGATGPATFAWSNGDTTQNLSGLLPGTYSVLLTDPNGCTVEDSIEVAAGSVGTPTISPQSELAFCPGGSVVLVADSAPPGLGYQWLLNGIELVGFTSQTLNTQLSGDFQVTWTGPCDADTSAAATVQVVPVPGAPMLSGDTSGTYCANVPVVLYATTAPVSFGYQWYLDGNSIANATSDSLLVTATGDYTLQYEGPCASPASAAVSIILEAAAPAPTFGLDSTTVCGDLTTLLQAPTAPTGYGYQWYQDGNAIPGANQDTYEVNTDGDYALVYVGACSSDLSESVHVSFQALPEPQIDQVGDTLSTLQGLTWQWYLNGNPIAGATMASHTATVSGVYSVEVIDASGCAGFSEELTVTVTSLDEWLAEGRVSISPNPASEFVEIRFDLLRAARLKLSLTDLRGRVLHEEMLEANPGPIQARLATAKLPAGTYILELVGDGLRYTSRLQVE